jgi:hypothetical protein
MRLIPGSPGRPLEILVLACVLAGCSGDGSEDPPPGGGAGAPMQPAGTGGTRPAPTAGTGGASGSGGSAGMPGNPGGGTGGSVRPPDAGTRQPDAGARTPDAGVRRDGGAGPGRDGGSADVAPSSTPMGTPGGGPQPSYAGEIPIYNGPAVGPIVTMDCPGDPTEGWTEYQDSFNVQRPHDVPINTRFSIIGGIYRFWVFPDDAPHSPTAMGRNPRTEARYGGTADRATGRNFQTGNRMYSADMLIERSAVNSAIMQIHTTASGGGPIGLRIHANSDMVNNGSLTVVQGSSVPGGLIDRWFNFKASLNADNQEVKIYINNCLKSTYRGPRGDGNFYFKNGVYFCKTSQNGCFSNFKNIHLYKK